MGAVGRETGSLDGRQALADPTNSNRGFHCNGGVNAGYGAGARHRFDGTSWTAIDPVVSGQCNLAMGTSGTLFTISSSAVYQSGTLGSSWTSLASLSTPPYSIVASNETTPTLYISASNMAAPNLLVIQPGNFSYQATLPSNWPASGYQIPGTGNGSPVAIDPATNDAYIVATNTSTGIQPYVYKGPVASHGTSWISLLGGVGTVANEIVDGVAVDSSARAVILSTEGRATAGVWRLNNPDVTDNNFFTNHHWRPWVQGLPNAQQPVSWVTGQYENGVFYFYGATWGRGVWKREARGGDF